MSPGSTDKANCQPPSCRGRCAQVDVFAWQLVAGHRLHDGGILRVKCDACQHEKEVARLMVPAGATLARYSPPWR